MKTKDEDNIFSNLFGGSYDKYSLSFNNTLFSKFY